MQFFVRYITLLLLCIITTDIEADVVEDHTDCYVINVSEMDVDPEESLMDILMMCPEFFSENGVTLASDDYVICIDALEMAVDNEAFLHNTKACEVSSVTISKSDVVGNGLDGLEKEISITFRNSAARSKAALWGNTYGNGQVYSDLTHHGRNFTLTAMVDANAKYQKFSNTTQTKREFANDVRIAGKWHLSDRDSLQIVLAQAFSDEKERYEDPLEPMQTYRRDVFMIATYNHLFNEQGASLNVECGGQYSNDSEDEDVMKGTIAYALVESELPIIADKLELMVGTEHKYDNTWEPEIQRQQYMHNDIYAMLYCTLGRWQISVGDRLRFMNFWHKAADEGSELWHKAQHKHGLMGSIGCNLGKGHYVQGSMSQRFYTPSVDDFIDGNAYNSGRKFRYKSGYLLPASYVAELRYTYQRRGLVLMASATNANFDYAPETPNSMQSINTSATLRRGIMTVTLGASYHHCHWDEEHDNYYNLKLKPSLSITERTRLSATMLYLSNRLKSDITPNTYLDIKLNHYITPRVNIFANYHDIAGQKTGNRALILGATFYIN